MALTTTDGVTVESSYHICRCGHWKYSHATELGCREETEYSYYGTCFVDNCSCRRFKVGIKP